MPQLVGDALVGVVFIRNVLSVIVLFTLTPWVNGMGIQNVHILIAFIIFAILLLPIPLLIWGKKARIATAKRVSLAVHCRSLHWSFGYAV